MGRRRLRPTRRLYLLVGAIVLVVAALLLRTLPPDGPVDEVGKARAAARAFLTRYVDADGRVARIDQGGDTVSEGQAYAMLLAVVAGDRQRFHRVWNWAATNLRRSDGLFAWRWSDGSVVDPQPASDADLDAAYALLLAWERFGDGGSRIEALRVGEAILSEHTTVVEDRRVLAAGPWAIGEPVVLNPSYFFPSAYDALVAASGDERWIELERSSYAVLDELMGGPSVLPPEWAVVDPSGRVRAAGGPEPDATGPPRFGFGAARIPVRFEAACGERAQDAAASLWPVFADAEELADVYDVRGEPVDRGRHPMMAVAASASARAAGAHAQAREWLDRAERLDRDRPTYYGSAWVALGRAFAAGLLGCRTPIPTTGGGR